MLKCLILIIGSSLIIAPTVLAATENINYGFIATEVYSYNVATVAGVIAAGVTVHQVQYPHEVAHVGDSFHISVKVTTPTILVASGNLRGSLTLAAQGCNGVDQPLGAFDAPTTGIGQALATMNGKYAEGRSTEGFVFTFYTRITVTGTSCSGTIAYSLCPETVPGSCSPIIFSGRFIFNVHVIDQRNDNQNRLCDASNFNTTCIIPNIAVDQNITTRIENATFQTTAPFDWEKFFVKFIPFIFAIVLVLAFFVRRDPIFGIMAIAALLFVTFNYAWQAITITLMMLLVFYILISILILRKSGGLKVA